VERFGFDPGESYSLSAPSHGARIGIRRKETREAVLLWERQNRPQFLVQLIDRKRLAYRGRTVELLLERRSAVTRAEQEGNPSLPQDASYRENKFASQVHIKERQIERCRRREFARLLYVGC
jgi:hypothetical protein